MPDNKTKETQQTNLFGGVVQNTMEIVERRFVSLQDENPKDTTLNIKVTGAHYKDDTRNLIIFGTIGKEEVLLTTFSESKFAGMPTANRVGIAVSLNANWTEATRTFDDVVEWLNDNPCTLTIKHDEKGRLFSIKV